MGLRIDIGKPEDEGEGEGEGEGSTQRDVTTRNVEELIRAVQVQFKSRIHCPPKYAKRMTLSS
jgi:hypothetical protein